MISDEFVLAVKRTGLEIDEESIAGPTAEEIASATKDVPIACATPPRVNIDEVVYQNDVYYFYLLLIYTYIRFNHFLYFYNVATVRYAKNINIISTIICIYNWCWSVC